MFPSETKRLATKFYSTFFAYFHAWNNVLSIIESCPVRNSRIGHVQAYSIDGQTGFFKKKKRYVVGKKLYSVFSSRFSIRNHHAARLRVFSAATCIYSYERYSYDWITKGKTWNFQIEVTTDDKAKRNKIVDLTFAGLNYQPLWFLYTRVRGRKNVDDLAENTEHELFKTEKIKRWDDKGNRAGHKATSSVRFIGNVFGVVASQTLGANRRN